MNNPVLHFKNVTRDYRQGSQTLQVLKGVDFALNAGQMVALLGPSGSGKSTFLHGAGLLDRPSSGHIYVNGQPAHDLSDKERTQLRGRTIGFVYQFHHLLPEFSALENIILPQLLIGTKRADAMARADSLLTQVGLSARSHHRPAEMSGGEQQRVAIARALANNPAILLADEPTGNLDETTAEEVFTLLLNLVRNQNVAMLIATHNRTLAARMDRAVEMQDGRLQSVRF